LIVDSDRPSLDPALIEIAKVEEEEPAAGHAVSTSPSNARIVLSGKKLFWVVAWTAKWLGPAACFVTLFPWPARADPFDEGQIMESVSKETVTKPLSDRQPMCNDDILRLLADQPGRTVAEMAAHFRVTQTAIRGRLIRLTVAQSVTRKRKDTKQRGRPLYLYYITSQDAAALAETADDQS